MDPVMTVFLSGATGFVGINLLEELLGAAQNVVVFADRALPEAARNALAHLPGRMAEAVGDVRDKARLKVLMAEHGVTRVIHAAVITSSAERERSQGDVITSVNLAGTGAIAQAAAEHGVERFLLVGSVAAYGPVAASQFETVIEEAPQAPVSLYGVGKSASEAITRRIAELHGMDYRIGRLGTVFGPWEHASGVRDTLSAPHQIMRAARSGGAVLLPRPAFKNWHYSRQVASDLRRLIDVPATRRRDYNLGATACWSLAEWCSALSSRMPGFRFAIGAGPGAPVELYETEDNALLSGARFIEEFGPRREYSMDEALDDYLEWTEKQSGWGVDRPPV